jgi:hypothetical protein
MIIRLENNMDKLHNISKDTCLPWGHIVKEEVNLYKFVTSLQDEDEWSASDSSMFGTGGWVGPRAGLYMMWRKGHALAVNQTQLSDLYV